MEASDYEGSHLVRIPRTHNFAGKALKVVLQAHIKMDKEMTLRSDSGAEGDLGWWPSAFIVVVHREWEEKGLLFVYAENDEMYADNDVTVIRQALFPMDKYFFKPKDAYMMLPSLVFGDEYLNRSKELYEIGEDDLTGLEREGVDNFLERLD